MDVTFPYDVFLNFRGPDTRHGFIGHLHKALSDSGFHAFIDDEDLESGGEIAPKLKDAIEKSRIAITVLSEDYASSSHCLTELDYILRCLHGIEGRLVLPVFYKVDPADVRYQKGKCGEALARLHISQQHNLENWKTALRRVAILSDLPSQHGFGEALARLHISYEHNTENWETALHPVANLSGFPYQHGYEEAMARLHISYQHNIEDWNKALNPVKDWTTALNRVASVSGFHYRDRVEYEHKFIRGIVKRVSSEISHGAARIHVADYPVGQGSQILEIRNLLDVESVNNVQMIGIHGIGGVGKSTLARAVYNLITDNFERSCFLQNVREESNKYGLKHLQCILLSQILGTRQNNLASEQQGISMLQNRLKRRKVLLILDDVDEHKQLQGIVGRPDWFGPGSRVIITTRDKQLLASHGVRRTYEVKGMNHNDARQLLKWKAFKTEEDVDPSYTEVLNHVVTYASGLPLALEVIGSNLFEKSITDWESAIKHYKRIPNNRILEILKVSFDALGEEEQSVFLDIACCLKGYKWTQVEYILHVLYDHSMKYHIGLLVEKSLIKISNDRVILHDLIEDMGKEIDRQKSPKEPRKRRRLWAPKDIIQVLKDNTGTSEIEIICGNFPISDEEEGVEWNENAFKEMKNLKILIIRNGNFSGLPNLPESVKVFEWQARGF